MLNVVDFGAVGDGETDDGPAFRAALAAAPQFIADHPFGLQPEQMGNALWIPPCTAYYRIVGDLTISRPIRIFGDYGAKRLAAGIMGFATDGSNPTAGIKIALNANPILQNLYIRSVDGIANDCDGIEALSSFIMERCTVIGFGKSGVHVNATSGNGGNANGWKIYSCWFENNKRYGLEIGGQNSNGGVEVGNEYFSNGEGAVYDSAFLGCTHIAPLAEGNGAVEDYESPDPHPFVSDGGTNFSVWVGPYSESGQGNVSFHDKALVLSGIGIEAQWGDSEGLHISYRAHVGGGMTFHNDEAESRLTHTIGRGSSVFWQAAAAGDGDELRFQNESDRHQVFLGRPVTPRIFAIKKEGDSNWGAGTMVFDNGFVLGQSFGLTPGRRFLIADSYPADEGVTLPPQGGSWHDGDRIFARTPTAGGFVGWVRVSGVWKGFGAVES